MQGGQRCACGQVWHGTRCEDEQDGSRDDHCGPGQRRAGQDAGKECGGQVTPALSEYFEGMSAQGVGDVALEYHHYGIPINYRVELSKYSSK